MTHDADNLTPAQRRALLYLLESRSLTEAAENAGVARKTLYRWLREPEFASEYRRMRREVYGQAVAQLQRHAADAVGVLVALMSSDDVDADGVMLVSPSVRLSSAKAVLDLAAGASVDDLASEVEEVKRVVAGERRPVS